MSPAPVWPARVATLEAENERLREELHYANGTADANIARANEAQAEIEQMRALLAEKADENEQLRKELVACEELVGAYDKMTDRAEAAEAENERLRALLRDCLSIIDGEDVDIMQFSSTLHKARAALEGEGR